jgi:hypothetical protein
MNFSSYEELYDVFKNTAVFYSTTDARSRLHIPKSERDTLGISVGDGITVVIVNQIFDDGYVKFNANVISRNTVTVPVSTASETNRDKKFKDNLSALFICKKGKNAPIPFDLSTYYNLCLLNSGLIFKTELKKQSEKSKGKRYTYHRVSIQRRRHDKIIRYPYINSTFDCYYINLENRSGKNIIKEKGVKPVFQKSNSHAFTLPREKASNSPFSKGDTIQVIAQRTKEMFNFPDRAK